MTQGSLAGSPFLNDLSVHQVSVEKMCLTSGLSGGFVVSIAGVLSVTSQTLARRVSRPSGGEPSTIFVFLAFICCRSQDSQAAAIVCVGRTGWAYLSPALSGPVLHAKAMVAYGLH